MLKVDNFSVVVAAKEVVKKASLQLNRGEVVVLMGPNGSGKSSLAYALAGHPRYQAKKGSKAVLDGKDLLSLAPEGRVKAGLFLAFQQPVAVDGVTVRSFLQQAYRQLYPEKKMAPFEFRQYLQQVIGRVGLKEKFLERYLHLGFSGGEKKRLEMLQLAVFQPRYALLDEIDSGLDLDALKLLARLIKEEVQKRKMGCLLITHYQRFVDHLPVDRVYLISEGRIVAEGDRRLIAEVEKKGYQFLTSSR